MGDVITFRSFKGIGSGLLCFLFIARNVLKELRVRNCHLCSQLHMFDISGCCYCSSFVHGLELTSLAWHCLYYQL